MRLKKNNFFRKAASGAPYRLTERATGKTYLGQLKPLDLSTTNNLSMNNILDAPNRLAQFHRVIADEGLCVVIFDK